MCGLILASERLLIVLFDRSFTAEHGIITVRQPGYRGGLPERFGLWFPVYQRFRYWRDAGKFDQILERLQIRLNQDGLIGLDTWMIELHRGACNPSLFRRREKEGPEEPLDHALGRNRGGPATKIYLIRDANGMPLRFLLSPRQASDIGHAQLLLEQVRIPGKPGKSRSQ